MKRLYRIITGVIFIGIFWLCEYNLSHGEFEIYLKRDINELKDTLFFVSILISIVVAFFMVFEENLADGKWKKIDHILYIGIMSFLIYPMTEKIVLISGLKLNRISESGQYNEPFIISVKDHYSNKDNYVWGRIPNKTESGQAEKIKLSQTLYDEVEENQKIKLNLKKGIFGIPYDPIGTK
ncbi:hypothetical protein [Gaetbulibacter jejuensis]|uniref:Uncharacterized protein n=1 Tax=Gaetbulibacter jejuensis TaxID=584607 RepID=A0ABN1JU44_9FLAO